MRLIAIAATALLLTACASYLDDPEVEATVDEGVQEVLKRLCRLPLDVMARNIGDNPNLASAAYLACPELRVFIDTVNEAVDQTLTAPVQIAPIRLVPE